VTAKEIQNFFRGRSENAEDRAEMCRVKEQVLTRMAKVMQQPSLAESACVARIPQKLVPKNVGHRVIDIQLLTGETFPRLIINAEGFVIGREIVSEETRVLSFRTESVFAVRVRSGFFGRIGLTRWTSIYR
jgi:hypothetical protein